MDLELAGGPAPHDGLGSRLGADQGWHVELVLGPQQVERANVVDLLVRYGVGQVEGLGLHRTVVAGAVHHQVEPTVALAQRVGGLLQGGGVDGVQRQPLRAGMFIHEPVQRRLVAGRHRDHCAQLVQAAGGGPADAGGRAHQPNGPALPVGDAGVQRHAGAPFRGWGRVSAETAVGLAGAWVRGIDGDQAGRRWKDSSTSPTRMPNLLITARLIITCGSTRNIQSSNSISQLRPSTGTRSV